MHTYTHTHNILVQYMFENQYFKRFLYTLVAAKNLPQSLHCNKTTSKRKLKHSYINIKMDHLMVIFSPIHLLGPFMRNDVVAAAAQDDHSDGL